jgi:hypothetical protein
MQKLDRLGWVAGFTFSAYGVRIGVRSNTPELIPELHRRLPFGSQAGVSPLVDTIFSFKVGGPDLRPSRQQYHLLYGNLTRLTRTLDLNLALDAFESQLQLHVAEQAQQRVFVHAGVVAWQGRAIVIPGRSLSGKSTLVRALVEAGATYYSDEFAVLDTRGYVHPYPLPIGVRHRVAERQKKFPIELFGGSAGTVPLPVGLVLVTSYKPKARWRPKPLSAGESLLALLANTVSAQRDPATALATLQRVVVQTTSLKSWRGEAEQLSDALLNYVSD